MAYSVGVGINLQRIGHRAVFSGIDEATVHQRLDPLNRGKGVAICTNGHRTAEVMFAIDIVVEPIRREVEIVWSKPNRQ